MTDEVYFVKRNVVLTRIDEAIEGLPPEYQYQMIEAITYYIAKRKLELRKKEFEKKDLPAELPDECPVCKSSTLTAYSTLTTNKNTYSCTDCGCKLAFF